MRQSRAAIAALALSFAVLGCNQRTQDLYQIEVERSCQDCDLRGANLQNQNLSSKYRVSVTNQPLSTTPQGLGEAAAVDLTGADLREANFKNSNLTAVILNETRLSNADLSRTNLTDAQLVGADLQGVNLRGANLKGTNFQNANLTGADLRDTDLSLANTDGADLTDVVLNGAPD